MISDIKIAASKEQDGPWEDLVPISLVTDTLYNLGTATPYPKTLEFPPGTYRLAKVMTRDDMKQSAVLTASSILESEIAKPIEPHHTIYGWVALDSLRHVGLTPGQIFFRVKLLDAAKKSGTYVAELPRRQPGESSITPDVPTIRVVGVRADISKFYVSYYDDPYPTPLAKQ